MVKAAANNTSHTARKGALADVNSLQRASSGTVSGDFDGESAAKKNPAFTGVSANKHGDSGTKEMVPRARIELATRGFSVRNTSDVNAVNTSTCGGDSGECTLKSTLDDAETSHLDGIREALSGLSKDDIITLLMDALGGDGR